ncbi:hypothetical protein BD779DRAFT_1486879 [Infundibulicybe gibba]|nr:hypothetical protein BD779DRAFT_1486879 [Infundibulicybe gibba]
MSSREPLWFCHECHSEMRPLMAPDPICASCHGSFVEKMENPSDDPREFAHPSTDAGPGGDTFPPGIDNFLLALQGLVNGGISQPPQHTQRRPSSPSTGPRLTFEVRSSSGPRTITVGGANTLGRHGESSQDSPGHIPTMSEFLRRGSESPGGPTITGPVMAQYLMALLGQRDPFTQLMMQERGNESGRMGDYVFNQEALDQIITQIMDNSNSNRPIPATEDIIDKLPREVLELKSPILEKDCAVCKEQFKLETEDPDEQVVITLPCKHPFHEPCILPWLKSSGTCPVCRYALIPQPEHHGPTPSPGSEPDSSSRGARSRSPSSQSRSRSPRAREPGLLHTLFGNYMSNSSSSGDNSNRSNSRPGRSNSGSSGAPNSSSNLPGSWSEDLD